MELNTKEGNLSFYSDSASGWLNTQENDENKTVYAAKLSSKVERIRSERKGKEKMLG